MVSSRYSFHTTLPPTPLLLLSPIVAFGVFVVFMEAGKGDDDDSGIEVAARSLPFDLAVDDLRSFDRNELFFGVDD